MVGSLIVGATGVLGGGGGVRGGGGGGGGGGGWVSGVEVRLILDIEADSLESIARFAL